MLLRDSEKILSEPGFSDFGSCSQSPIGIAAFAAGILLHQGVSGPPLADHATGQGIAPQSFLSIPRPLPFWVRSRN